MVFYDSHNPNCLGSLGFNVCHKELPAISQVLDCSHLDRRLTVNYIGDDVACLLDDVWGTRIGCCFPR